MIKIKHVSKLITMAIKAHCEIKPCCLSGNLIDAFTVYGGKVMFWYNDKDNNTHVVSIAL